MALKSRYDAIYLSPHPDDAAISCGGQIALRARRGEAVLILTLCAGDPPSGARSELAEELRAAWGKGGDAAARRAEDRRACEILGVDCLQWDEPDSLYRRHPENGRALYATRESLFAGVHPADCALARAWRDRLRELPPAGSIVAPLGVGGHADHRLTRRAAEEAAFGAALLFYEDFPYVLRPLALWKALWPRWRWRVRRVALDDAAVSSRCSASAAYASQLGTLFRDREDIDRRVRRHVRRAGGERLWATPYRTPWPPLDK